MPSGGRHVAWAVLAAALALLSQSATAGTTVGLYQSFAGNINFVTSGNTLRAGDNTSNVTACRLQSGLQGVAVDAGTSSGTVSGIPAGSTIVAAYLYYAGSNNTVDSAVTFDGNNVTASRTFTDFTLVPFFGGFVDVTSLVNGNGTYSFGGLTVDNAAASVYCGNQTELAGWALVVIYSNPAEPNRVINVYDGFQVFQNNSITLNVANFNVPNPPAAGNKFAVVTWEGDPTLSGNETLQFGGTTLTDNCNGANNQYNSTINTVLCTGNANTDDVFYGTDIDTFSVDGLVSAGQTSATTSYQSGQDAVILTAQVVSISNTPVSDLGISKSDGSGNVVAGSNTTYTLSVTNHGPAATAGTTTVTDALPAGETYVTAAGSGWACADVGSTVTCSRSDALAVGASFPAISLTVTVSGAATSPIVNTATVSGGNFDNASGNDSASDSDAVLKPDYSTSTKTWVDLNGGDVNPGDIVEYTVTVKDTAGVPGTGISVTDDIPLDISGFSVVSKPAGSIDSSTGTGTGANGDGFLDITGISVPANGTVAVVFDVTISASAGVGDTISNTATIAGGVATVTAAAPDITVSQSLVPASGNKVLYLFNTRIMDRTPQTVSAAGVSINGGQSADWTLSPTLQKDLLLNTGTVSIVLAVQRTGGASGRSIRTELRTASGTLIGTSNTANLNNNTVQSVVFNITLSNPVTVNAGDALVVRVDNTSTRTNRTISVYQDFSGVGASTMTFDAGTVINVDSVGAYNAPYGAGTTNSPFEPNQVVYIRAVISDPFGSYDIDPAGGTAPTLLLKNPSGVVRVNGASMPQVADSGAATKTFEYAYTIMGTAMLGHWTASVTGFEGTEATVTHTANGSFDVEAPEPLIMNSVSAITDPIEGAVRPKALPGSQMRYTITVYNTGQGPIDSGTLVITEPIPANTALYLANSPPFTFIDGSTSSGLSVAAGDSNIAYSNDGGASFGYTPSCTRPCSDPAITNIKITLNGSMNASMQAYGTTAGAPYFAIWLTMVVN